MLQVCWVPDLLQNIKCKIYPITHASKVGKNESLHNLFILIMNRNVSIFYVNIILPISFLIKKKKM